MPKQKIALTCLFLFSCHFGATDALAGTTQIYSPAGLPRGVNPRYSVPNGISTRNTFSTPPIPLNDSAGQSLNTIPLKSEIKANGQNGAISTDKGTLKPTTDDVPVESFFKMPDEGARNLQNQNKSPICSGGRVIWHVLDNLGVPMFLGKDGDLDPSISGGCMLTPNNSDKCQDKPPNINFHNRIPQSELEGIDVQTRNDAKLP